ncbi:MAG: helix-turn-helix domain-containing protein [candidate division WOR-3 bacterium]
MSEKEIPERLRELRKDFGLSQEKMAQDLGVTVFTLQKWERGIFLPGVKALIAIADKYSVSMNWLLLGEGPRFIKRTEKKKEEEE